MISDWFTLAEVVWFVGDAWW